MKPLRVLGLVTAMVGAAAAYPGGGIAGQAASPLDRVEALTEAGRAEEARVALTAWWEAGRSSASRTELQRGYWLRGRLTVDPEQASIDYRRLTIEYPGGPYSDRALFRLAQSAHALGDGEAATELVRRLVTDYPTSAVRRQAEAWLSAAGAPPPPRSAAAPANAREASTARTPPAVPAAPRPVPDSAPAVRANPATAAPGVTSGAATPSEGAYAVQFGAFLDEGRAWALANRVVGAGLEARVVRIAGNELVRVRVGRFDSIAPASDLLQRVERLGFTAAIVRDANREEAMRDG